MALGIQKSWIIILLIPLTLINSPWKFSYWQLTCPMIPVFVFFVHCVLFEHFQIFACFFHKMPEILDWENNGHHGKAESMKGLINWTCIFNKDSQTFCKVYELAAGLKTISISSLSHPNPDSGFMMTKVFLLILVVGNKTPYKNTAI